MNPRRKRPSTLAFEALERRELLAADILLQPDAASNDLLIVIYGTQAADTITLQETPNAVQVTVSHPEGDLSRSFGKSGPDAPDAVLVWANSGDDLVQNDTHLPMTAHGQADNDTLIGGWADDTLFGGADRDTILGRAGNDQLFGAFDPDERGSNEFDIDTIHGGSGVDVIHGSGGADTIYGDAGNDFIYGGSHADVIDGGAGHDRIFGGRDSDILYGAVGNDELHGEAGDDQIFGHEGDDLLRGGDGNDRLVAGLGDDELYGDSDDDELNAGPGADLLDGGAGNDRLFGGRRHDRFDGNDEIFGGTGDDLLEGAGGDDRLDGGGGNDQLFGEYGNDALDGADGTDTLSGGRGNDTLRGGSQDDLLEGGPGHDQLWGGFGNDTLHGGLNANRDAEDGDDVLRGDAGDDRLFGQLGNDLLYGGDGVDALQGDEGNDLLYGEADDDSLLGGAGNDFLKDDAGGNNLLDGGDGDDQLVRTFGHGELHAEILTAAGTRVPDGDLPASGTLLALAGTEEHFGTDESGYVLEAPGGWTRITELDATTGELVYSYEANGTVLVKTESVDLPIGTGLTIRNQPKSDERSAIVDADSISFSFDLGQWINDNLTGRFGLEFDFPSLSGGIASGAELREADESLPLRNNQPYLFASFDTNLGLEWGGVELAAKVPDDSVLNNSFKVILDPTDPFLYLKANRGSGAMSINGRAPFHPLVELQDFNEVDDVIYGHVFLGVDDLTLPKGFSMDGSAIIDFDANDDGQSLNGALGDAASWFDIDAIGSALDDVSLGVNGELFFGPKFKQGFLKHVDVSIKVGQAAVAFDGGQEELHFRGKTVNPFEGTPLEQLDFLSTPELDMSGSVLGLDQPEPQLRLDVMHRNPGGTQFTEFHADNHGVELSGRTDLYGQSAIVRGRISTDGEIRMFAYAQADGRIDLPGGTFDTGATFDFSIDGSLSHPSLSVGGSVDVYANAFDSDGRYGISGRMRGELEAAIGSGSGYARAEVTGRLGLTLNYIEYGFDISTAAEISDRGLRFKVNSDWYTVVWSDAPAPAAVQTLATTAAYVVPGAETTDTTPTLAWNRHEDATAYELKVDNLTTGQSDVVRRQDLLGMHYTVDRSLPAGTYRVATRPLFADGGVGEWNPPYEFQISPLLTPRFSFADLTASEQTAQLGWFSVPGATHYELVVDNLSTGENGVIHQSELRALTYVTPRSLPSGRYLAHVKAHRPGESSDFSKPVAFEITDVAGPRTTLSSRLFAEGQVSLHWTHISQVAGYELIVEREDSGQSVLHEDSVGENQFDASALPAGHYQMRVRAFDDAGIPGQWSERAPFRVAVIDSDLPDLRTTTIASTRTHMLLGQTELTFAIQNQGFDSAAAFDVQVIWSDDAHSGNGDDAVVATLTVPTGLEVGDEAMYTIPVQLDRAEAFRRSSRDNPISSGQALVSTEMDLLSIVIDAGGRLAEIDVANNEGQGLEVDTYAVTQFPWDVDGDLLVGPLDALFVINRLGLRPPACQLAIEVSCDLLADVNGDGAVGPIDALAIINRLSYEANHAVIEAGVENAPIVFNSPVDDDEE